MINDQQKNIFFNSLSPDGEGNESFHATYEIDTISLL